MSKYSLKISTHRIGKLLCKPVYKILLVFIPYFLENMLVYTCITRINLIIFSSVHRKKCITEPTKFLLI